ncbi:MAG: methyltransferase [Novosphingobium sp.]|nr:methyltransferase [Novosphingobium sp.]
MTQLAQTSVTPAAAELLRYREVRAASEGLTAGLSAEDCQVQSMPDVSPAKWHLAHTTWFFETFLLAPHLAGYEPFDPAFTVLFNSYYVGIGARHPRGERGLLTRPSLAEVYAYRQHVDAAMERLMAAAPPAAWADLVDLGLHHEQQHQELILMDVQHVLSCNPLQPAYRPAASAVSDRTPSEWTDLPGGLHLIGHDDDGFAFDNETPRHRVWLEPFEIADRLVTAGDYLHFIEAGGYRTPELWLSDGWAAVEAEGWHAPLYWEEDGSEWSRFTLEGRKAVDPTEPVLHVSFYEADAYARWTGCRLPTEAEWEVAAGHGVLREVHGHGWQWTASPYVGYPGYSPAAGAVGEYNGKFMVNQLVLRGGSSATPPGHIRSTYRNFFPPAARWAFSAIRLAR